MLNVKQGWLISIIRTQCFLTLNTKHRSKLCSYSFVFICLLLVLLCPSVFQADSLVEYKVVCS